MSFICIYVLPFCGLPFQFLDGICAFFCPLCFCYSIRETVSNPGSQRLMPMFSSESSVVLVFTFSYLIHFN